MISITFLKIHFAGGYEQNILFLDYIFCGTMHVHVFVIIIVHMLMIWI